MILDNPVKYLILLATDSDRKINIDNAAKLLNISTSTIKKYLNILVKDGYLDKREDGYYLTPLGEKLLNTIKSIKNGLQASSPYVLTDPNSGSPIPLIFKNYKQLLSIIENEFVDKNVLDYHFEKYMINWFKNSIGDEYLLELFNRGIVKNIDDLKNYLKQIMNLESVLKERIS